MYRIGWTRVTRRVSCFALVKATAIYVPKATKRTAIDTSATTTKARTVRVTRASEDRATVGAMAVA